MHCDGAVQGEKLFALEEWVELANGCLCCSLKDDFLRALEALMEQRQRFDYILVETTGANHLSRAANDHHCSRCREGRAVHGLHSNRGSHAPLLSSGVGWGVFLQ